tara:strand:- start:550 stop:1143 length:594 start_codon:yes stop_codon:yes gene_type:complete
MVKISSYAAFTHIFLGAIFITLSYINKDIRGIFWLMGAIMSSIFTGLILGVVGRKREIGETCLKNGYKLLGFSSTALPLNILTFTQSYLIFPMMDIGSINYRIIFGLEILFIMASYDKLTIDEAANPYCKSRAGEIVISGLGGYLVGYLWYRMLSSKYKSALYYNDFQSNNVVCSKPSKQKFKCKVYKGGQLITALD